MKSNLVRSWEFGVKAIRSNLVRSSSLESETLKETISTKSILRKEEGMDEERFDFENLKVYQKALEYVDFVYEITKNFPKEELFSLTDQFKRASISIRLNIAEGSGGSRIEFNRFLKIGRRSIRECVSITAITKIHQREIPTAITRLLSGTI